MIYDLHDYPRKHRRTARTRVNARKRALLYAIRVTFGAVLGVGIFISTAWGLYAWQMLFDATVK